MLYIPLYIHTTKRRCLNNRSGHDQGWRLRPLLVLHAPILDHFDERAWARGLRRGLLSATAALLVHLPNRRRQQRQPSRDYPLEPSGERPRRRNQAMYLRDRL